MGFKSKRSVNHNTLRKNLMSQYPITITGNLTDDPCVTKFSSDKVNTRLRIASSRRTRHTNSNGEFEWRDSDTVYINIEVWGQLGINTSKSLEKGMPVIALGSLCTDTSTDNESQQQRERSYMRGLPVGIDMNRYIVASQRMDALHTPEGMVLNCGSEALHINKDYTVDKDDVIDETGVEEVVPASFDDPREAEAEKEEAAVANF